MVRYILPATIGILAAAGCNQLDLKGLIMPTGEGVEKRFDQSSRMNEDMHAGVVEAQESYMFYVCTDPHINETHENLSIFNDALRNDNEASFGVILGDCIDIKDNICTYLNAVRYDPDSHSYDYNIYHILGNHDLFFNGWVDFREKVGPSVYWFEVEFPGGKDLYVALDTATGTLGRKQTVWFKSFLDNNRDKYRHCIVMTHTNFFYTDNSQTSSGNMPLEESFSLIEFLGKHNVSLVLQGHDHYREDLTYKDVRYIVVGTIRDESTSPEYLKIQVGPDNLELDWHIVKPELTSPITTDIAKKTSNRNVEGNPAAPL